jgi:flagellar hook-associated protein 2
MSSVSSTNSSTTSSIYGTRNVISGLASGIDTETLIENAISGYETKITSLQAKKTKYEWKQDAYRSIINKLVSFNEKYTSYTSSTNLSSATFFNNATKVTTIADNSAVAAKVSATGRTSSDVEITSIDSIATAARYAVKVGDLGTWNVSTTEPSSGEFDLDGTVDVSAITGNLTLSYGGQTVSLSFGEQDVAHNAQEMADLINEKLADENITYNSGNQTTADQVIKATADGDTVKFETTGTGGNSVYIYYTSGKLSKTFDIETGTGSKSFVFDPAATTYTTTSKVDYLNQKGISISFDGTTKTVYGPTQDDFDKAVTAAKQALVDSHAAADLDEAAEQVDENAIYAELFQSKIEDKFGKDTKLRVSNGSTDGDFSFKFSFSDGGTNHTLSVSSSGGADVGFSGTVTNYVDTGNTLEQLVDFSGLTSSGTDDDGNALYDLTINGTTIQVSAQSTLSSVMSQINSSDMGVKATYSKTAQAIVLTATDTGSSGKIQITSGGLAEKMFGTVDSENLPSATSDADDADADAASSTKTTVTIRNGATFTVGQDAKVNVNVNGIDVTLNSSSNTIDIDGMSVTIKGTFSEEDGPVTFNVTADADTIVSAVKSMVEDFNTMVAEIKSAYTTMPLEDSNGDPYEPLSDDDMADMSDSAIERYEEKAKTGLLFGDSDLSSLYSGLINSINTSTAVSKALGNIGISTSYSDGTTTLTLNETTLREALDNDPDQVRDALVGTNNNGLMQSLSTVVSKYAATTGAVKGILIEKAGSTLAPTSIYSNTWQTAMDDLDDQISTWQDKMSDKVDYYTTLYTNLEVLISEMNSQSSMLSSLSGGY